MSFDLVCGLAAIGASLRRQIWVDQVKWKIYPNMSVLLVGPSGIGKDTAIDGAEEIIQALGSVKVIGGRTSETLLEAMSKLGNPACAVVLAHELSAFIGRKDYQQNMIQDLTDLMSTKAYKDISLKSDMFGKRIMQPTLSMLSGSTAEWLHKAMPPDSLEGGFFPRFLILYEEIPKKNVPLIKYSLAPGDIKRSTGLKETFFAAGIQILDRFKTPGEISPLNDAQALYDKWYGERLRYFSPLTADYAHRCRDHMLRVAMLSAACRLKNYIDEEDIYFSIELVKSIGATLDRVVASPTIEATIVTKIERMLPATGHSIYGHLGKIYKRRDIMEAFALMNASGQIREREGLFETTR